MIYTLSDLHLDITKKKDMKIFGDAWVDYEEKIFENWKNKIKENDLVLIPGDISWAMKLEDARLDLDRIEELPGNKILLKGNHDYWWQSLNKINELGYESLYFLQNNSFVFEDTLIAGTRGWLNKDHKDFKDKDEKIFNRELLRLEMSLETGKNKDYSDIIVLMHYPPFNRDNTPNEFEEILKKYGVRTLIYGHLHSEGLINLPEGNINGINYICASGDYIDFDPLLIKE